MEIKKGATFLMFKINTPNGIDFLKEHKKYLMQMVKYGFADLAKPM